MKPKEYFLIDDPLEAWADKIFKSEERRRFLKRRSKKKENKPTKEDLKKPLPIPYEVLKRRMEKLDEDDTEKTLSTGKAAHHQDTADTPGYGSPADTTNPFSLDTRGGSKAFGKLMAKKQTSDYDKTLGEIAPEFLELAERQKKAEELEKAKEDSDLEQERYYETALRLISKGEIEKAEKYLQKAGLTVDEIQQEIEQQAGESKPEARKEVNEGQDMDSENKSSEKQNVRLDSELGDQESQGATMKQGRQQPVPDSQGKNNNAKHGSTHQDHSKFAIQEALGDGLVGNADKKAKEILEKRWKRNQRKMLEERGVPLSQLDNITNIMFENMLERKTDNNQMKRDKPTGQHQQAKDEFNFMGMAKSIFNTLMGTSEESDKQSADDIGSEKQQTDPIMEKPNSDSPDTITVDWIEEKLKHIEENYPEDTERIRNLRLEIQDMKSSGVI